MLRDLRTSHRSYHYKNINAWPKRQLEPGCISLERETASVDRPLQNRWWRSRASASVRVKPCLPPPPPRDLFRYIPLTIVHIQQEGLSKGSLGSATPDLVEIRSRRSLRKTMYVAAKSCFARSAPDLLRHLGKLSSTLELESHTVLFSISPAPSCSNATLTDLVTRLTSLPSSLGCLSAPVGLRVHAKTESAAERGLDEYTLCSVAVFNREDATPFRSTIPGREAPQVGRWHAFRKGKDAKLDDHQLPDAGVDWESVWAQRESPQALPEELRQLRCVSNNSQSVNC